MKKRKIAIYSGSFNPPTIAHREVLIRTAKKFAEVWVVPVISYSEELVPLINRIQLLEILLQELPRNIKILNPKIVFRNAEEESIQLLMERLNTVYKEKEFYFITGSDFVNEIETLPNWEAFLENNNFFIIPRRAIKIDDKSLSLFMEKGRNISMVAAPRITNISQKEIRKFLSFNYQTFDDAQYNEEEDFKKYVPKEIWEYIYENELYNKTNVSKKEVE